MNYIVWVGGSIIYEGENIALAKEWRDEYVDNGYDDVIIEDVKEKKWKIVKFVLMMVIK